jgi:hypothetical protein
LRDAATHITALPKKEADLPEWQAAIGALMLVADLGGPTMFARIGVMRALNRHVARVFNPDRKDHHWGKRKLKRDE